MWGRQYWPSGMFGAEYWPTGTAYVGAPAPAPAPSGTGGPRPRRRKYELDLRPEQRKEPERKPKRRRVPEVHVALSLVASLPVLLVEAQVVVLAPITARLLLSPLAVPIPSVRVRITGLLGLATERVDELEAVLAVVLEDD